MSSSEGQPRIKLELLMSSTAFITCLALISAISLTAQESVCLRTGFCLEAEGHMISDGMLVVQSGNGTLQFPVDQVERITALPLRPTPATSILAPKVVFNDADPIELLIKAALRMGLEPEFVRSVAMVESGINQKVVSNKGAIGLMQLMPGTAGQLGVDPWQMEQNAMGGAAFLRQLLIKYSGNSALALAAYNAGPGAVEKYNGVPPFPETRRYVVKVLEEYARQQHKQVEKTIQAAKAQMTTAPVPPSLEAFRLATPKSGSGQPAVQQ